jgi:hypothetical protein
MFQVLDAILTAEAVDLIARKANPLGLLTVAPAPATNAMFVPDDTFHKYVSTEPTAKFNVASDGNVIVPVEDVNNIKLVCASANCGMTDVPAFVLTV